MSQMSFAKYSFLRSRAVIKTTASEPAYSKSLSTTWAESFIFAGSSAVLLLLANLFPTYWIVSFFALTPFLYRIIKASPGESCRLGFLFGFSFFAVSAANSLTVSPFTSMLHLLSGTALLALFGWVVGWARQKWGFYPSLVAVLWFGLEMGLVKLGFTGGLLGKAEFSHPFLYGLVGLFGFLTVSSLIVLLNSLLVLAIIKTLNSERPGGKTGKEEEKRFYLPYTRNFSTEKVYAVPEGRAPPIVPKTIPVRVGL